MSPKAFDVLVTERDAYNGSHCLLEIPPEEDANSGRVGAGIRRV